MLPSPRASTWWRKRSACVKHQNRTMSCGGEAESTLGLCDGNRGIFVTEVDALREPDRADLITVTLNKASYYC